MRQRPDGLAQIEIEAREAFPPATVAEASGSDTEAECEELVAKPKRAARKRHEQLAAVKEHHELPRQVQLQEDPEATTQSDLTTLLEVDFAQSTVPLPQLVKQNGDSKSDHDQLHGQQQEQHFQHALQVVPSLDAEPKTPSQQPREHISSAGEPIETHQEGQTVMQLPLLEDKEQLEFEMHLQQLLKEEQQQAEPAEADVLDVAIEDRPNTLSEDGDNHKNSPAEATGTQQPVVACVAEEEEQKGSEPVVQWSQLANDARSGANQFANFPPELKINRLNYILQPLQTLFSKIVECPVSANRDLTQLDCDFIEWAVETATESITAQPIPSYQLNGHRYFLNTMDAAMARVERLETLLSQ